MAPPPQPLLQPQLPLSTTAAAPAKSSGPPSSLVRDRLSNISSHIMGSASQSIFTAAIVPQAPEDPLFGLMRAYRQDTFDKKVDLGIGAYRDDNAKPWVLPVVRKVSSLLIRLAEPQRQCRGPRDVCGVLNRDNRQTTSCARIPTSTTNICPSRVCQTSQRRPRNSSWVRTVRPSRRNEYVVLHNPLPIFPALVIPSHKFPYAKAFCEADNPFSSLLPIHFFSFSAQRLTVGFSSFRSM